jgi:dihydrofolate synthase/folylpolyglutamate synthase
MTYQETLKYLFGQLPIYQRSGKAAYKANLENTLAFDEYLGHPHKRFRTIHVAGTNGKGSVSHLLASVLQSAGYRTGLYTSPHLLDFRERIRINGEMIPEQVVVNFVEHNYAIIEKISPSFFEMTVALAFDYFAREQVDVAVVEVGLGGRLDSTNIITPDLSVITNIGIDHTMFLGNTLETIAGEKAGIIKPGIPVVVGRFQPETAAVFRDKAAKEEAPIVFSSEAFALKSVEIKNDYQLLGIESETISGSFKVPLLGSYQHENIITVMAALKELRTAGYIISDAAIHSGVEGVLHQTGLLGRWQKVSERPLVICDTGHNADGIERVVAQIKALGRQHVHIVLGMVNDKDVKTILKLLPVNARYYFTRASIPRALDEKVLHEAAQRAGLTGEHWPNVLSALEAAKKNASDNDLIFIGGSTFVVAEALGK